MVSVAGSTATAPGSVPTGMVAITTGDDLIGDVEDRLREDRERHDHYIREQLAYLRGLRSEAQQQAAAR
jgi:hypothetical protein